MKPARFVSGEPSVFSVGGCQLNVAVPSVADATSTENAGRVLEAWPSETLIRMDANVPDTVDEGVPLSRPVDASKLAHAGLLAIWNVSVSPSGSLAVGWKL